ncbi:hypothetical protein HGE68_08280 [Rhodobacteraceae bacterium R_SAG6]|nr:hypothetical protein [Rhodobacteraceae bacterium G21628-S1]NKX29871.1 hypothetical protein [Rhodobacteraceae bacterium R_SAG6]
MWEKLIDSTENYFREGVLVKFKTLDTAGDEYKFALGVRIDHNEDISFIGFGGRTWGYGRCTLPYETRFEGKKYTVSRDWLINNFAAIAEPQDTDDIWVCKSALSLVRKSAF